MYYKILNILEDNVITEMNWTGAPQSLRRIFLETNEITEINWDNVPQNLSLINLSSNKITEMLWKNCPRNLTEIDLSFNEITEMSWENGVHKVPQNLQVINLRGNNITEMNYINALWNSKIHINHISFQFEEYKKSHDNIRHLPYISFEEKDTLKYPLINLFCKPPSYNTKKLFMKGQVLFHEDSRNLFEE